MSFEAYRDAVEARTGRTMTDLCAEAREKGLATETGLAPGVKAGAVLDWLATVYGLGRGHGMAVVSVLKGEKRS